MKAHFEVDKEVDKIFIILSAKWVVDEEIRDFGSEIFFIFLNEKEYENL